MAYGNEFYDYYENKHSEYEAYIDRKLANILERLGALEKKVDMIEKELMLYDKKDMESDDR